MLFVDPSLTACKVKINTAKEILLRFLLIFIWVGGLGC